MASIWSFFGPIDRDRMKQQESWAKKGILIDLRHKKFAT